MKVINVGLQFIKFLPFFFLGIVLIAANFQPFYQENS